MKKVAIVTRKMITGGVERALAAMLRQIDYNVTEVDLYLESLGGELFDEIPKEVHCIQIPPIRGGEVFRHPLLAARKLNALFKLRFFHPPYVEQCFLSNRMLSPVSKRYDIAVSYHAPNTVPVFYVIDGIQAETKILWLHGELQTNAGENSLAYRYHERYDKIFAVSQYVKDGFLKLHPQKAPQTAVFHNYVDSDEIRRKAANGPSFSDKFDGMRILTIGRLDRQKGIDIAVMACKRLRDLGYQVRWYVCGEGAQREELEQMIAENGLNDVFILLGNQSNPYGYLKNCGLYVQTSRSEGYCIAINEARILCKPVITTAIKCAREQLENGVTGWIVPIDAEAVGDRVSRCIDNPNEVEAVRRHMESVRFEPAVNINSVFNG